MEELMTKLLWLISSDDGLSLGFRTMADAEEFLRTQSENPKWLAGWKLSWVDDRTVEACNKERVVMHFNDN